MTLDDLYREFRRYADNGCKAEKRFTAALGLSEPDSAVKIMKEHLDEIPAHLRAALLQAYFTDGTIGWAAIRYIIARDFNEFDPEKAAMLWKLQNGGAQ